MIRSLASGNRLVVSVILFWTSLVVVSLYANISGYEEHSTRLAISQARDFWNKDHAFREWATRHGGLYVEPDERTPPNPLLARLPHRDVETKDGRKLTLMNPAYMMRQMTEEFASLYGVRGNITGLVLLDPAGKRNKPDAWELKALKLLDQGRTEVVEKTRIEDARYLRLMRPMVMREGCVPCHGHLGFKVGDVRGGVSVSVPMAPYEQANSSSRNKAVVTHLVVWLIGVLAILYIVRIKRAQSARERLAREMLDRSQRMDALGKLTGGIAHDFNNMLGVIMGYSGMLRNALSDRPHLAQQAGQILHASERGRDLTRKLLSYSRRHPTTPGRLDLNDHLRRNEQLLEKTLTPRITLVLDLADALWPVWLDAGDLEDAVLNLTLNAAQAIEGNGTLTFRTRNQRLGAHAAAPLGLAAGDHVVLSVADTGEGMDAVTRERLFEPFYTTKGEQGTGLGLSQVHGFIERSEGAIEVSSEAGRGTCFVLYFPRCLEGPREEQTRGDQPVPPVGDETILLVDDEPALLESTRAILVGVGYRVLCADSGAQALEILAREPVDLLLTDIIMPGMDGHQLSRAVRSGHPQVRIQLASGYEGDVDPGAGARSPGEEVLAKPYDPQTLLRAVRERLDAN